MSNPFSIADTEHPSPGSTTKLQFMRKLLSFFSSLFFFFLFFSFVDRRITAMPKFHYMPRTIVPRRSCFVSHCCLTCFEFFFFFFPPRLSQSRYRTPWNAIFFPGYYFILEFRKFPIRVLANVYLDFDEKKWNFYFLSFSFLFFFLSFQLWEKISSTSYRRSFSPITTL